MSDSQHLPEPPSDDEIEQRLKRAVERSFVEPAAGEDESEDDVERRFRRLQEELGNVGLNDLSEGDPSKADTRPGGSRFPEVPEMNVNRSNPLKSHESDPSNYRGLGVGISAAYVLVGSMVMGFGIGWAIDKSTGGSTAQPIGAMLGCIVGIAATIWLINRNDVRRPK